MPYRVTRRAALAIASASLLAAGCSSVSLWPFGSEGALEHSRVPANAREFQCDGGKRFYLRILEGGAAWVIFPEREFRLDKVDAASGTRYTNGSATLELN